MFCCAVVGRVRKKQKGGVMQVVVPPPPSFCETDCTVLGVWVKLPTTDHRPPPPPNTCTPPLFLPDLHQRIFPAIFKMCLPPPVFYIPSLFQVPLHHNYVITTSWYVLPSVGLVLCYPPSVLLPSPPVFKLIPVPPSVPALWLRISFSCLSFSTFFPFSFLCLLKWQPTSHTVVSACS